MSDGWHYIDTDGAYRMMPRLNPWAEHRALDTVFPEPLPACEDMLGDIRDRPKNAGGGAGPVLRQVLNQADEDAGFN